MEQPRIFNGRFTIQSPRGGHRTFRVSTVLDGKLKGKRIIGLLIGPENTTDYEGFGFVDHLGIFVWKRFHDHLKPTAHDRYAQLFWSLATEGEKSPYYASGYRLLVEKNCLRCNRTLTTPESIALGIGPECAKKGLL